MPAAVAIFAGKHLIRRVVFLQFRRAEIKIHRRDAGVGRHVIQPDLLHLDFRRGMGNIEKDAGRTHRPERPGGDDIYLLCCFFCAILLDNINNLFRIDDNRLPFADFLVDFCNRF